MDTLVVVIVVIAVAAALYLLWPSIQKLFASTKAQTTTTGGTPQTSTQQMVVGTDIKTVRTGIAPTYSRPTGIANIGGGAGAALPVPITPTAVGQKIQTVVPPRFSVPRIV